MTSKTVLIGGKEVQLKASALIPRLYRFKFGRDMLEDMRRVQKDLSKVAEIKKRMEEEGEEAALDLPLEDLTIIENSAYIMAKHADPNVPTNIEEWLEQFDGVMDVYAIMGDVFELWRINNISTSRPVKK